MKLNYDLLYRIMQYLEPADIVRTMRTCHAVYDLGTPLFLKDVTYDYQNRRTHTYHRLLVSNPSRFICVTRLVCRYVDLVACGYPHNLLVDFIRLSSRLQDLDITFCDTTPGFDNLSQISMLQDLRHLKLSGRFPAAQLLEELTVPLKTLETRQSCYPYTTQQNHYLLRDPIPHAARFRSTLETFSFILYGPASSPVTFAKGYSFPAVQSMTWHSWHPIDVALIARTFPRVESLFIHFYAVETEQWDHHLTAPMSDAQIDDHRLRNRSARYQWNASHSLKYLRGTVLSLWAFGIKCQAEVLDISITGRQRIITPMIQTLLTDIRPTRLRLSALISYDHNLRDLTINALIYESIREIEVILSVVEAKLLSSVSQLVSCSSRIRSF